MANIMYNVNLLLKGPLSFEVIKFQFISPRLSKTASR